MQSFSLIAMQPNRTQVYYKLNVVQEQLSFINFNSYVCKFDSLSVMQLSNACVFCGRIQLTHVEFIIKFESDTSTIIILYSMQPSI